MTAPGISAHNLAPSPNWLAILQQAGAEVFSMMVGVEVQVSATPISAETDSTEVTGMVGIAGAISAMCSVRCNTGCATAIASRMLGIGPEAASAQQCDAIGEICNMVAGQFKAKIGLESQCSLSVPTVISGRNYRLHGPSATYRLEVPLLCEGDLVWLALEVRM